MQCFNPAHGFTGRMLFLDLDVLIVSSLAPIIDYPADFALTEDALAKERAHLDTYKGRRLVRKFNSSVMVWNGGEQTHLFMKWTPEIAKHYSTDQDLVGAVCSSAAAMPLAWFPRISQPSLFGTDTKVVLVKKGKNHTRVHEPWFNEAWGGWQ